MTERLNLGGTFTLPNTSMTVNRMGYGAMQLAGRDGNKLVWGPPRDAPEAIAVLREAVASGVNHIDTSDFYGPHVTNQLIKQATEVKKASELLECLLQIEVLGISSQALHQS